MVSAALGRVLLAADGAAPAFNTDVVRRAWRQWCDARRTALREARAVLVGDGDSDSDQAPSPLDSTYATDPLCSSYIDQLWTDHLIVESSDVTYRVPYTVDAPGTDPGNVTFGTPVRVVVTYVAACQEMDMDLIHLSIPELSAVWSDLVVLAHPTARLSGPPVKERKKLASQNKALPDGSYPIPNVAYLKKAIKALGRAKDYDKALNIIKKRARELGVPQLAAHLKPKGQANSPAQAGAS